MVERAHHVHLILTHGDSELEEQEDRGKSKVRRHRCVSVFSLLRP